MKTNVPEQNNLLARQTVRFYLRHMLQYKGRLIAALTTVPFANALLWYIPPLIVSNMLQRLSQGDYIPGDVWGSFGSTIMLYAACTILSGIVLWRLAVYLIWSLELKVMRSMSREIFNHLLTMSANFHNNRFGGSLVSQANKLTGAYLSIMNVTMYELYTLFVSFIVAVGILFPRVPWIALALLAFSLLFMALATQVTKPVRRLRATLADAESSQVGMLADAITNVFAIKSFAASQQENQRYAAATEQVYRKGRHVLLASIKRDTVFSTSTVSIGVISLILTVVAVVEYQANIGTAFLVLTYTGMIGMRLWEFAQNTLREYNRGFGDARDMIEILAIQPEVKDPPHPEEPRISKGAIAFQDMHFTHPDSRDDETLFAGLTLAIAAGEKIGLVGRSGSGKTTLTKLLLRFNDIDGGAITIDGQNIAHITQERLRQHIAYVPQEPLLFHRTIRENIAYGRPDATDAQVAAAAHKAFAHEFIEKLPKGYDTTVGERGVKLSGGQRQRIAIARAILKDAPILVLDEATSALDSESEKLIQNALWELMKQRTAIVIAHRLSTIQKMDRILVLDDGKVVEEGSHQQLLQQNGTYATLWKHQSGGFIED